MLGSFIHIWENHCHGHKLFKASGDSITQHILDYYTDDKVLILANLDEWKKVKATDLKDQLLAQGFTRALIQSEVKKIETLPASALKKALIIVDRVKAKDTKARISQAVELCLKLSRGSIILDNQKGRETFYKELKCPTCKLFITRRLPLYLITTTLLELVRIAKVLEGYQY